MKANSQAWNWLVAGVLVLGLSSVWQDGGAAWVHQTAERVVSRSTAVVALAMGRADRFAAEARTVMARDEDQSCRFSTIFARVQTKIAQPETGLARVEAIAARQDAALAWLQANRERIEARTAGIRFEPATCNIVDETVVCPGVQVNVMRIPRIRSKNPVGRVQTGESGPI